MLEQHAPRDLRCPEEGHGAGRRTSPQAGDGAGPGLCQNANGASVSLVGAVVTRLRSSGLAVSEAGSEAAYCA